jgi:leucine dehydrogenase
MISIESEVSSQMTYTQPNDFLDYALKHQFGDIHFKVDPATGMKAIIAIHSTKLGPSLGGCRFIEYPDVTHAIEDAMRLAIGMSFKAASVNLPLGGGKAVIIKPKGDFDRQAYFHAFGKFVNELNGRYITALDSGTQLADMDIIAEHTPYVASRSNFDGDPSPSTAKGVFIGIKAAVAFKMGRDNLKGVHVALQGLGHVGFPLARFLHEAGAKLTVSDVNPARVNDAVREFGATVVPSDIIHTVSCDVFSPCALGAIINDVSIHQLNAPIIAGAANNQLAHRYHGQLLHDMNILYAVDYIINAGGLIYAASKYLHTHEDIVNQQINHIGESLTQIFERSKLENRPIDVIADAMALEKLA